MALKFYYDLMSQPSRALYIILKMSGVIFEDHPVTLMNGDHLTEDFANNINRFQHVPCIIDGDYKLAESVAIVRYLSAKGEIPEYLYPKYFIKQARVDEFLEWQHTALRITASLFFRTVWMLPLQQNGKRPSDEKVQTLKKRMEENFNVIENVWLKKSDFLTGSTLTVADIFAACEIEQTRMADYDVRVKYPKIRSWLKRTRVACLPHYDTAHKFVYQISGTAPNSKL